MEAMERNQGGLESAEALMISTGLTGFFGLGFLEFC
jgi:hypothetical protein